MDPEELEWQRAVLKMKMCLSMGHMRLQKAQIVDTEVPKVEWMQMRMEQQPLQRLARSGGIHNQVGVSRNELASKCFEELFRRFAGYKGKAWGGWRSMRLDYLEKQGN